MSNKRKITVYFDASCSTSKRSVDEKISKITNIVTEYQVVDLAETIVHAPMEPSIEPPSTSERRITRFQQSILDKSLQSISVIGQDTTTNNTTVPKPEKKKNTKKN